MTAEKTHTPKKMLRSLQGEVTADVPLWLMRQAGRYLPEYRELRAKAGSFLKLCYTPEMAAEITLQPLRRFDLDAAILFSDILVIPHALGQPLAFVEGEGPKLDPLSTLAAFDALDAAGFEKNLLPIYETLDRVKADLKPEKTLIGFAGAPWTVACYMIQGHGGGSFARTREMALADPEGFTAFLEKLADVTTTYLLSQIKHGADVVQIFDSWAGLVPAEHFDNWVIHPTKRMVDKIRAAYPGFPIIGFPRQAATQYVRYAVETGVSGLGLDPAVKFADLPKSICLQGNLAPELLLAGGDKMAAAVEKILVASQGHPYIFNLGHGVIKETPHAHVAQLVDLVHAHKRPI